MAGGAAAAGVGRVCACVDDGRDLGAGVDDEDGGGDCAEGAGGEGSGWWGCMEEERE